MSIHILGIALLAVTLTSALPAKFLAEKPSDLVACSLEDAKFNECLVKNLQTIFINWKDGIPGSDIVGPIDPFTIKFDIWTKILNNELFSKYLGNGTDFKDIVVKGMSQATITEASYDPTKYEAKVVFKIPKLIFHVDYKLTISGGVNNLQISTKGSSSLELGDLLLEYRVTLKPRVTPEDTFFDVLQLEGGIKKELDAKDDLSMTMSTMLTGGNGSRPLKPFLIQQLSRCCFNGSRRY
ncbi:uncharacterized protein LOC133836241 [Drosophila sulfurigaster albostrigata]|uniref:uncharacterized protein LOC133836241 n=1 Tax=Drosophila sulfurigaster albostrigata TaxID=89887 RepID=UPI002D21B960|nr:uncharacterized protein LOC133836241 [Drosophila sulfurigaster albostrigata]